MEVSLIPLHFRLLPQVCSLPAVTVIPPGASSADKSGLEGQIRTSTLALFPPDLKDTLVFCVEHKAEPVQLWNGKEMQEGRAAGWRGLL